MPRRLASIVGFACTLLLASGGWAATPFQLAVPGAQLPRDPDVEGVRLVLLHGQNATVSGVDVGIAAFAESDVQSGLTINMGVSVVRRASSGVPVALMNFHRGTDGGLNLAFVNVVERADTGASVGFVNITSQRSSFDLGGLNVSDEADAQVGMLNVTRELRGLQLGILNFASNGFLPVFPLFNFPGR